MPTIRILYFDVPHIFLLFISARGSLGTAVEEFNKSKFNSTRRNPRKKIRSTMYFLPPKTLSG